MAVLTCCDLCMGHPLDYEGKSGGDVRLVKLEVDSQVHEPDESRRFHACAPCRLRIFGEILEKIALEPQAVRTAEVVNPYPINARIQSNSRL